MKAPPWIVQACPLSLYTIIPVDSIFYQLTMITFVRSAALSWKYHVSCPCWRQNHKWWGCGSTPLYGPGAELLGLNNCSRRESDRETKKRPRLLRYGCSSKDKPEKVGPNLPQWNVFLNLNGELRLHRRLEKYLSPFFSSVTAKPRCAGSPTLEPAYRLTMTARPHLLLLFTYSTRQQH